MLRIAWFIAYRFLRTVHREKNITIMTWVCWLSIFIGAFSLALIVAIMNGFEKATHEKMQGMHADIIISAPHNQLLDYKKIQSSLQNIAEIKATSPRSTTHGIALQNKITSAILLTGINPETEQLVSTLFRTITQPASAVISGLLTKENVIIGEKLAHTLDITIGDKFEIVYPDTTEEDVPTDFDRVSVKVAGIFKTGIEEFDLYMVFCNLSQFSQLFPEEGVTEIGVKLNKPAHEEQVITTLKKQFPALSIYSWKSLYPALVASLILEKYAMFLILTLVILVGSMSILALLFMLITQKELTIAILQTMGMTMRAIMAIFALLGAALAITATIAGIGAAYLGAYIIENYIHISLPDVYYVTHIPAHMNIYIASAVFLVVLLLSLLALLLPIVRIKRINIAQVLRFAG